MSGIIICLLQEVVGVKLAEALMERKALQDKVTALVSRLKNSVAVQEGDEPAERFDDLVAELETTLEALEALVVQINYTNAQVTLPSGETLMEALARRERLRTLVDALTDAYRELVTPKPRFGRHEIRTVRCVDPVPLRKYIDRVAREYRLLDAQIQAANWEHDLQQPTRQNGEA